MCSFVAAEFFIEMWKRRTAEIEYDWDVADYEEEVSFSFGITCLLSVAM